MYAFLYFCVVFKNRLTIMLVKMCQSHAIPDNAFTQTLKLTTSLTQQLPSEGRTLVCSCTCMYQYISEHVHLYLMHGTNLKVVCNCLCVYVYTSIYRHEYMYMYNVYVHNIHGCTDIQHAVKSQCSIWSGMGL